MGESARRLLRQLRPYTLLFVANIGATVGASLMDGATFVLMIPFLRTLFGQQALPEAGGSQVEKVLNLIAGPLLAGASPQDALRNVVFVLAEAAPKTWAIQNPERAALVSAGPVSALTRFWPLRMLSRALIGLTNWILPGKGLKEGPFVSEEELLALADVAVEEEVIEAEERKLIEQIIEFGYRVSWPSAKSVVYGR